MRLGYVLFYVDDVVQSMTFYETAFGMQIGFLHESKDYGEMKTGETKLGFVNHNLASTHGFSYDKMNSNKVPGSQEIGFVSENVSEAFERAVKCGAVPLKQPTQMPWGQVIAYVRDCNGFIVELCSPMG